MRGVVTRLVLVLALVACSKKEEPAPAPKPAITEPEVKRGRDACTAYVAKVCACAETVAAQKEPCKLARALPEVVELSMEVAMNGDAKRLDTLQAADSIRKTVKTCIEETAKLPAAGCP
jgi:hypothetical protein